MAVLINKESRVIIQGISGSQGSLHTKYMLEYGAKVVAGVAPGRKGQEVHGVPVFNTIKEAQKVTDIDATMILVPPYSVKECAAEAIAAGIPVIVVITEHVPVQDTVWIRQAALEKGCKVIGPNTIGLISPGKCKVGVMPGFLYKEGPVGIVSRSGTLTHEIGSTLAINGIGQSTCIGIGGDPVPGTNFKEALALFREDPETEVVILIGEIGGCGEEEAAKYMKETNYPKPVVAFIAGQTAPQEKQMGHAGAIISGHAGTAEAKYETLADAGVQVAHTFREVIDKVSKLLAKE